MIVDDCRGFFFQCTRDDHEPCTGNPSKALRAWCGIHPSLVLENELERTRKKLKELNPPELGNVFPRCVAGGLLNVDEIPIEEGRSGYSY
jgi:hypothetical protein